jgi:uncharacterized membrane protein
MWFFHLYRFYISVTVGIVLFAFFGVSIWIAGVAALVTRVLWYAVERMSERAAINRSFTRHCYRFKQLLGPYGIRIANKAENDYRVKRSLAEVFTPNREKLKKNVEQLEVMDTLFNAGMRPEGDEYLLHDCKLKYGKHRLEQNQ